MAPAPSFSFGLDDRAPAITPASDLWTAPLPASRHAFGPRAACHDFDARVTYGDYFSAARRFLEQDQLALLRKAAGLLMGRTVTAPDISRVAIFLVKHGAFYHPAHVEVDACGRRLPLVLNVAASTQGRHALALDYESIARLNQELAEPFWPLVFGQGVGLSDSGRSLPMFLGQWLQGYHEFHLTAGPDDDHARMVVWDPDQGPRELSAHQVRDLLRQAAFILAYAYNPLTFEAILNWHHAAGDFVAKPTHDGISVRLITVRNYAPVVVDADPDVAALLDGVLLYLVDISLRLRLDRLDGTGRTVCHPPAVVPAIFQGFSQGLHSGCRVRGLPQDFTTAVRQYFALHGQTRLMPMARAVVSKYRPQADESTLLQNMLAAHVSALADVLARSSDHPQHTDGVPEPPTI